jgi:hypothetical protein
MDELRGRGWPVSSEPFWNHAHGAWWRRPDITGIVRAYEKARQWASSRRGEARTFALDYDARRVFDLRWAPFLAEVEKEIAEQAAAAAVAG